MSDAKMKGTVLISTVKYIEEKYGEDTYKKIVAKTSPDTQKVFERRILASTWYDADLVVEFLEAVEDTLGVHNKALMEDMGRFSAEFAAKGVYKVYFIMSNPKKILRLAERIWSNYYTYGEAKVVEEGDGKGVLRVVNTSFSSELMCRRNVGWMKRAMELAGGKDVVVKHTACVARGDVYEEFVGTWK